MEMSAAGGRGGTDAPTRPAMQGGHSLSECHLTAGLTRDLKNKAMLPLGPCAESLTWYPTCEEAISNGLVT